MAEKEEEISLVDVYLRVRETIRYLWSKKIWMLLIAIFGGAIGFSYAFLKPTEYNAKLTFIAEQGGNSGGLSALGGIASSFGFGDVGGQGGLYDNQANLIHYLESRSVIEEAYLTNIPGTKITFAEKFAREYGWRESWDEDTLFKEIRLTAGKPRDKFTLIEDSVLFEMYYFMKEELLEVNIPNEEGSILEISVKTIDDTLSLFFPETLLSIVSRNYTKDKTSLAKSNVDLLQYQADSVRAALNESLLIAASSTDQVFGLNPALNVKRVPVTKQQIDIQASSAILEQIVKNLEIAKVQLNDKTPLIEIIDTPRLPLNKIKASKISSSIIFSILFTALFSLGLILKRFFKKIISSETK